MKRLLNNLWTQLWDTVKRRRSHRRVALAIILGAIALLVMVSGCRGLLTTAKPTPGTQIVLSALSDPKTFNPPLNQEFPNIFLFTFRGLTREDGTNGDIVPELAESWEISEDLQRVTFTLREGLHWSDGEPLTADDVVFTYQDVIFNEAIPTDSRDGLRIGENRELPTIRKVSDRQVEFSLPEPFSPFIRATSGPPMGIAILPKHILQDSVNQLDDQGDPLFMSQWATNMPPDELIVNGPYLVESYLPGQRVIFRRNPNYWRQDDQGNALPYIDRIVWQIVESTDTQLLQFRSGGLDVMGDTRPLKPEYFSLLKREEDRGDFQVLVGGPWSGTTFVVFNLNQAKNDSGQPIVDPIKSRWFNTQSFRQAIAHSINRPSLINNIYRGISEPQNSPVSVQSPYYLSPEDGLPVYDYDLDQARSLLESAGFTYNAQGALLDSLGNRVQFDLLTNSGNEVREAIGAQIKNDLSQIGIQINFTPIDFGTLVTRLTQTRDWDMILIGFTGGIEPHAGANLWTSQGRSHLFNLGPQAGQESLQDWTVSDWEQEIDRLFTQGAQELNEERRKEIYGEFQIIVQEQVPMIHLVHEIAIAVVRDRLQGLQYSGLPTWGLWNIEQLRIVD